MASHQITINGKSILARRGEVLLADDDVEYY